MLLFNLNFVNIVSASGVEVKIANITGANEQEFLRLSNGSLVAISRTTATIYVYISDDDGVSWSDFGSFASTNAIYMSACLNSDDTIYVAYYEANADDVNIKFRRTNDTQFYTFINQVIDYNYDGWGLKIGCDGSNNLHVFACGGESSATKWRYRMFNAQSQSWGTIILVKQIAGYTSSSYLDMCLYGSKIYIGYKYYTGSVFNIIVCYKNTNSTSFLSENILVNSAGTSSNIKLLFNADDLYLYAIVNYLNGSYYAIKNYKMTHYTINISDTIIYDVSYSAYLQDVSYNIYDETINIMYYGTGYYHANNLIRFKSYNTNTGVVSEEGFMTIGLSETTISNLCYSYYPESMRVYSGYAIIFCNTSDSNYLYYKSSDDLIFLQEGGAPPGGEETGCMTYDSSYMSIGTGFNYYNEYGHNQHVMEFQSKTAFNGTLQGLELYVPVDFTDALGNWHLYVDGVYTGSADCCYAYQYGYILQFNDIGVLINDEKPIFDIYRADDYVQVLVNAFPSGWILPYWIGDTSIINNKIDGTLIQAIPQYMLYFTLNETQVTDCGYSNSLDIVNIYPNATGDFNVNQYKTIFFSATVNSTASPVHKLSIYKSGVLQYEQGYPKDLIKCSGIYGYTPTAVGTYYAVLTDSGTPIGGTYVYFNVTSTTKTYAIWTYPNPCEFGQEITVNTYINDTGSFAVCLFTWSDESTDYDKSIMTNFVSNGTDSFIISTGTLSENQYYLRIFKQVSDIWSAVGEIYTQLIYGAEVSTYIDIDPHEMEAGETVHIHVYNSELLTRVAVFSNTVLIYDNIPRGLSNYYKVYDTIGVYQISVKKYINDAWVLIDSEQLTVITPADNGLVFGFIPNLRGTSWGWLLGLIIVIIFLLVPMRLMKNLNLKQNLPSFVYVFMGCTGIVTATILPFFDTWVIAFLVIISIIYIGGRYLLKNKSEGEE